MQRALARTRFCVARAAEGGEAFTVLLKLSIFSFLKQYIPPQIFIINFYYIIFIILFVFIFINIIIPFFLPLCPVFLSQWPYTFPYIVQMDMRKYVQKIIQNVLSVP